MSNLKGIESTLGPFGTHSPTATLVRMLGFRARFGNVGQHDQDIGKLLSSLICPKTPRLKGDPKEYWVAFPLEAARHGAGSSCISIDFVATIGCGENLSSGISSEGAILRWTQGL
jgi:hypothetical protein